MPKRLAITIAGAVSLGSYEAGVLYEVLTAIKQHNSTATPDNQICIDVLTGASAGGMTALILGQKLLYCGDEFKSAYDNPLYNTWVKTISLAGLQNTKDDESSLQSLFSSDLIEQISTDVITGRYNASPLPPAVRHPAAADTIHLGVALTNLNGVDYGYDVKPGDNGKPDKFIYIDHGDQMTAVADGAACDNEAFWTRLREAAVACGAFPFAFRPKDLERNQSEYIPEGASPGVGNNVVAWAQDPQKFTYSDGGILQNQPLGIAKNLVDDIDPHECQNERYYLFVSPNAKDATANDNFHADSVNYVLMVRRLISVVLGQSGFHDWITAEDYNKRIALLDDRADGLCKVIEDGEIAVQPLAVTADGLLKLFFPNGQHVPPGATEPETLADAQQRIAVQYASEMHDLGDTTPAALAFRDAVLAFESAAGLGARDHMEIYGVTATDTQLAGAGLCAFLGFFDQKFRDHDYDVGRQHARDFLTSSDLSAKGAIGPINYPDKEDIHPIETRYDGLKLSQVPPADMDAFKAGLRHRVNQMLKALIGPWSMAVDLLADQLVNIIVNQLVAHM